MSEESQSTLREVLEEQVASANEANAEITETSQEKADRVRDEKGRFAEKTEKPEKVEKVEPVKVVAPAPDEVIEAPQPIPRPSSWKKEMWPIWDKLNSGAQLSAQEARQVAEYNSQREQQFASGVSTYKQEAERAKPIMDAIAPFAQEIQQAGAMAPQLISNLLGAHQTLYRGTPTQKLQLLAKVAQDYGIPLQAFYDQNVQQQYLNSAPRQQIQQPQAPDIHHLVEEALTERELKQTVEQMARNTEKYPFFHYVRSTMGQLLAQNEATDLDDAYHKALDAPEHSMLTSLTQQQHNQAEEQRKLEAQQKVAKVARSNAVSTKSATPASSGASSGKTSVRDALIEAMAAHQGNARV